MTGSPPLPPGTTTAQLAQSLPGFDPTPVINAVEQRLTDYLAMPTQQILEQLRLARISPELPANPGGPMSPLNTSGLISPVVNALGTLGNGPSGAAYPTSALNGISSALGSISGPVQQVLSAVEQGWQGASGAAAGAKTAAALANGTQVATQATGLQNSLSAAAADVAQARTQLIEIIEEFEATLAASLPFLPFSVPQIVAAAAKAVTHATQVMTETQSSLAAHAGTVSAIGSPVPVTAAPQLGASLAGPVSSLLGGSTSSAASPMSAMSMLSPLMSVATAGISPIMSAVSAAGGAAGGAAGPAAATDAATGTLAGATAADPKSGGDPASALKSARLAASVPPAGGSGGGGSGTPPVPRVSAPMMPAAAETVSTVSPGSTRVATGGMPMTGAGMMGAPLAGAGHGGAGGTHNPASFLHTTDQGGKLVGGRDTVAPPVIGETEPSHTAEVELQI